MNQSSDIAGAVITPGERLKRAREQAGLSIEKVAKDLYLETRVIRAIEVNHFKDLGAPVYAKGYLRKYARLLGVTEEEVLAEYQKSTDVPATPNLIPVAMGSVPETRQSLPRWVLWLVIGMIVLAGVATLLSLRSPDSETATQGALISQPLAPSDNSAATPLETGSAMPTAPDEQPVAGTVTLRFSFSGDSWVEVYDASNQQVLNQLGTPNSVREITASPPLRVKLGAAAAVRLKINSRDVELPVSSTQSGIARFVVKADGSLQ